MSTKEAVKKELAMILVLTLVAILIVTMSAKPEPQEVKSPACDCSQQGHS